MKNCQETFLNPFQREALFRVMRNGAFCVVGEMNMAKLFTDKNKSIMCPKCRKFLTKADKADDRVHTIACPYCKKWIWYKANDDDYRLIKSLPPRMSGAGVRFY